METTKHTLIGLDEDELETQAEALEQAQALRAAIRSAWARDFASRSEGAPRETSAVADLRRWTSRYVRGEVAERAPRASLNRGARAVAA